ncbi:MAG: tetratricopeptide repeat protein [Candidatus Melainabacteria bacterium]|nr:tetratricopeptide repeat protein [Candidatus Melainabacteria bacterium]
MTSAASIIEKANDAMANGDQTKALEFYDQVIELEPDNAEAWFCKGTILSSKGELKQAVDCYARSAQNAGDRAPLPLYNMGNALQKLERYEEAIDAFEKALKIDPTMCDAWINRGRILDDLGHHAEAIRSYDVSLDIDPNDSMAWTNRGNSFRGLENYKEALASYANALQLDAADFKAVLGSAVCYAHLGDTKKALDMFADLEHFDQSWVMVELSFVLALAGRNEDALKKIDEAIAREEDIPEAWNNRAEILARLKRHDEALASFDRAIDLADAFDSAWFGKARLLYNLGRKAEARSCLDYYFKLNEGTDAALALKSLLDAEDKK